MTEIKEAKKPETKATPANGNAVERTAQRTAKLTFSSYMNGKNVQEAIFNTLQTTAKTQTFTSSLISAYSTNPQLRTCEMGSVVSAALLGESLNLSPSPQLGHFYLVPFKDNKTGTTKATFVLGWKGYYQLALRSGQYKNIDAVAIKEGELKSYNPITGEIELEPIMDPREREKAKTIGYYAFFELLNGFRKEMYWSKERMEEHALKYSKGYKAKKGYTFWERGAEGFDAMALKTMIRQLIGKYGIMSIEMQKGYVADGAANPVNVTGDETGEPVYFDSPDTLEADFSEVNEETGEVNA